MAEEETKPAEATEAPEAEAKPSEPREREGEAPSGSKVPLPPKMPPAAAQSSDKVHTWPHLVKVEFLIGLLTLIGVTVWSIFIDAPLEAPANPSLTPNPSKAPWYFLGLQEMLVYFDPWFAGVVLPSLIIVGLMVIPYVDINPKGNGYYTFRERPFAIATFNFGFLVLWIMLIFVGTFMRGPGWNFFAPWQVWDDHKVVALTNVDLNILFAQYLGLDFLRHDVWAAIFGLGLVGAYYGLAVIFYLWGVKKSKTLQDLGVVRYGLVAFLFLTMMGLVIKMLLRWSLNVKYLVKFPWINLNI
jgi:hypothetical protein